MSQIECIDEKISERIERFASRVGVKELVDFTVLETGVIDINLGMGTHVFYNPKGWSIETETPEGETSQKLLPYRWNTSANPSVFTPRPMVESAARVMKKENRNRFLRGTEVIPPGLTTLSERLRHAKPVNSEQRDQDEFWETMLYQMRKVRETFASGRAPLSGLLDFDFEDDTSNLILGWRFIESQYLRVAKDIAIEELTTQFGEKFTSRRLNQNEHDRILARHSDTVDIFQINGKQSLLTVGEGDFARDFAVFGDYCVVVDGGDEYPPVAAMFYILDHNTIFIDATMIFGHAETAMTGHPLYGELRGICKELGIETVYMRDAHLPPEAQIVKASLKKEQT